MPLPEGVVPAIVDADLWQRAQEAVAAQTGDHTRNERLPFLLRGLIFCTICGRKLWPTWRRAGGAGPDAPKRRVYRCASQNPPRTPCGAHIVHAEKVEEWAWAKVLYTLEHPVVLAAERERQQQEGPDPLLTDDLEKAQREMARAEREQRKLTRRYAEREEGDGIPWQIIERELKALEAERAQWEATAAQITLRLAKQRAHVANLEALTAYCERMRGRLAEATWEEQRTALEALDVRVDANGQHWHIRGEIPLEGVPDGDIDSGTDGSAVPSDNLTRFATSAGCVICGRSAGASTECRRPISSAALSCAAFAWPSPCSRHSSAKSTASRPPSPPYWRSSRDDSSMTFSCAVPTRRMMASNSAVCSEAAP